MAKTSKKKQIQSFLIRAISLDRDDIAGLASERFDVTRQYVNQILRQLGEAGIVEASGATRARRYSLVTKTDEFTLKLDPNLEEDRVWREQVKPKLDGLGDRALEICQYGLTEMLNNVVDHSEGSRVRVRIERNPAEVTLNVVDNGVGVFRKIKESFDLEDEEHAVLELSKGKLTTDPERHTGEGIFFTSRMFDRYALVSGTLGLVHLPEDNDWLIEGRRSRRGTMVSMTIDPKTRRTTRGVYDKYTAGDEGDYRFNVTHVPMGLARYGEENLVSRSQAKRVIARLNLFKRVVLDFSDIAMIGQAFADEIFRVFAQQHPEMELVVVHSGRAVRAMIGRAQAEADGGARVQIDS
jgi:anti-sigma regulatory factor (Ser/Thr protein kinase)